MNPALVMLLVVAAVFLGFSLIPSQKKEHVKKKSEKSSANEVASLGKQRPYLVARDKIAEEGTQNLYGGQSASSGRIAR